MGKDLKRKINENEEDGTTKNEKKNYSIWKKEKKGPPSEQEKLAFNVWGKNKKNEKKTVLAKIENLKVGKNTENTINFRCTFKSKIKETKLGNMFSFHGMDTSNEIQFTVFPNDLHKFIDVIELNKTYEMSNFTVKKQSKEFAINVENDDEIQIILCNSSLVKAITDDDLPPIPFNFKKINEIENLNKNSKCDIFGIICKDWGIEKSSNDKTKRDLSLTDESKETIMVTLWGKNAEEFNGKENSVLAIRNGSVGEWDNTKIVNCFSTTLTWVDPELRETGELKNWFNNELNK